MDKEELVQGGQGRSPADVIEAAVVVLCCLGLAVIAALLACL